MNGPITMRDRLTHCVEMDISETDYANVALSDLYFIDSVGIQFGGYVSFHFEIVNC